MKNFGRDLVNRSCKDMLQNIKVFEVSFIYIHLFYRFFLPCALIKRQINTVNKLDHLI